MSASVDSTRDDTAILMIDDHRTCGIVPRTRWELFGLPAGAPSAPPARWLYRESRIVVLLDLRRGSLMWSWQVHRVLECVLTSLAAGPVGAPQPAGLPPLTLHITVALGAREGWPMRVLVQGYRLRCGEPVFALREEVGEQLRLALSATEPAAPVPAVGRGLHGCVRDGLFCLSLLPPSAAPALAVVTDAVGAPLDAPLLSLRQLDVALLLVLCPEHQSALAGGAHAPFGLVADLGAHHLAAEMAAGLLLLPETLEAEGGSADGGAPLQLQPCIPNALLLRACTGDYGPCHPSFSSHPSFSAPRALPTPTLTTLPRPIPTIRDSPPAHRVPRVRR